MRKRKICAILLLACLCLSGCASEEELQAHLQKKETSFTLWGASGTKILDQLLAENPVEQVYLERVEISEGLLKTDFTVSYSDCTASRDEIDVVQDEQALSEAFKKILTDCKSSGVIVFKERGDNPPDLSELRTRLEKENYLDTMGVDTINYTVGNGDFTKNLTLEYRLSFYDGKSADEIKTARESVRKKTAQLADQLHVDSTLETVRQIHDWLVDHAAYDEKEESVLIDHTPYGVLLEGKGVCDGYTYAAKLLLDAVGIENEVAMGKADGEDHVWNLVRVDGQYYHMDVTWDDPVDKSGKNHKLYDYFLIGSKKMAVDHTWEKPTVTVSDQNFPNFF